VHYSAQVSDAELVPAFASPPAEPQRAARAAYDPARTLDDNRAAAAATFGAKPQPLVRRARDAIVAAHRGGYLAFRWNVFRKLVLLANRCAGSQAYVWFTDVQDLTGSGVLIQHAARPSKLQALEQQAMVWFGTTALFVPYVYLLLAIALIP